MSELHDRADREHIWKLELQHVSKKSMCEGKAIFWRLTT